MQEKTNNEKSEIFRVDVTDKVKIYRIWLLAITFAMVDSSQSEIPEKYRINAYNPLANLRFSR